MRTWAILLAGPLIWAVHFFTLYGIGEFVGDGNMSRLAVLVVTLVCLIVVAAVPHRLVPASARDAFAHWRNRLALGGIWLSAIAVAWQGLPALLAR